MITFRQINIENHPYYIFNDMINIKIVDPNLLIIEVISFKSTDTVIYKIKYITTESFGHENIDSENLLYIIFNNADGYLIELNSIEENNEDKYLHVQKQKSIKKVQKTFG